MIVIYQLVLSAEKVSYWYEKDKPSCIVADSKQKIILSPKLIVSIIDLSEEIVKSYKKTVGCLKVEMGCGGEKRGIKSHKPFHIFESLISIKLL